MFLQLLADTLVFVYSFTYLFLINNMIKGQFVNQTWNLLLCTFYLFICGHVNLIFYTEPYKLCHLKRMMVLFDSGFTP